VEDIPDSQDDSAQQRGEWTPVDVVRAIESLLMHTAHMLRRVRWFKLLCDSQLTWSLANDPMTLHRLVFENGRVVYGRTTCDSKLLEKSDRGDMDLSTYDRMRVLTTELRRLVCEGRTIELGFSSKRILAASDLKRALRWI
jgi:DNA polymerase III subunit epsilon